MNHYFDNLSSFSQAKLPNILKLKICCQLLVKQMLDDLTTLYHFYPIILPLFGMLHGTIWILQYPWASEAFAIEKMSSKVLAYSESMRSVDAKQHNIWLFL